MYDTDKYKNYMSMIPQSWLGKAKALGLMGMGGGSTFGQLGNTDPRPTPDWLPRNFQSPNRTPTIENGEMGDWFRGRLLGRSMMDPSFENYGRDSVTGEKYSFKNRPPMKFQSTGSDEKGNTKYEIRPYSDTVDWSLGSRYSGPDTPTLAPDNTTSLGLPGGVSWNYNPFQIIDRKTNRIGGQAWMQDKQQFADNFGLTDAEGLPYTEEGEFADVWERIWKKAQKGNYAKAANLYNKMGSVDLNENAWINGVAF